MEFSDLNPHIRYAKIHFHHINSQAERSMCYDCRLFFVEEGFGAVEINGENYQISNNTALYLPPQSKYRFSFSDSPIKIIVLDFDLVNDYAHIKASLGFSTESAFQPERAPEYALTEELKNPIVSQFPQIQGFLSKCTEHFLQKPVFYREKSSALLKLCLIELVHSNTIGTIYTDVCEKVIAYIHKNYADSAMTNEDISNHFNYHPYHLSRIMKQETGKTLHQYLIYYRIRVAKNLLLTTQNSIEQISWQCGFGSTAYFIKTFKDHTGETPTSYRKQHLYTEL